MQLCKLIITSLTPPLFIEVPVPIQWSGRSCICVLRVLFLFRFWYLILFRQCGIFVFHFISARQFELPAAVTCFNECLIEKQELILFAFISFLYPYNVSIYHRSALCVPLIKSKWDFIAIYIDISDNQIENPLWREL